MKSNPAKYERPSNIKTCYCIDKEQRRNIYLYIHVHVDISLFIHELVFAGD